MADLCGRFIEEDAPQNKKPSSTAMDQMNIDNHVLPLLGTQIVAEITRADIDTFKRAVREVDSPPCVALPARGGIAAVHWSLVAPAWPIAAFPPPPKTIFNLAEAVGHLTPGDQPRLCRAHVERYREEKKAKWFLSLEELGQRPGEAIRAGEADGANEFARAAVFGRRFSTGARLCVLLDPRCGEVDLEKGALALSRLQDGPADNLLEPPCPRSAEWAAQDRRQPVRDRRSSARCPNGQSAKAVGSSA